MKKQFILLFLLSFYVNAQFFDQNTHSSIDTTVQSEQVFNETSNDEPDQGVDAVPNPNDPVSINQYLLLLMISSIWIGCYQIKISKSRVN